MSCGELGFTLDTAVLALTFKIIGTLMWGVDMQRPSVALDLGPARMFSTAIFETYFSYHKDSWITATDYNMYVYLSVLSMLSPLTAILLLINL